MATNRLLTNAKEYIKRLDDEGKKLNRETMQGISDWMDKVRSVAVSEYMEPNKYKSQTIVRENRHRDVVAYVNDDGKIRPHNRLQKPIPKKTTIRTGTLSGTISARGTWQVNRSGTENKFSGMGRLGKTVLMWVRPQSDGYLMRFTFGKGGDKFMEYRLRHNRTRPFIEPAIRLNNMVFDATIYKRINRTMNQTI